MIDPCLLGLCDGSGWIVDEATRSATACRCQPQLVAQRRTSGLSSVIPRRYRMTTLESADVAEMAPPVVRVVSRFMREIDVNLDAGRGLWLYGSVGTGKTTLAMLVSKAALDAGRTVAIYSLPRLLADLRTTFSDDTERSYVELLDRLTEVDLLHIDDVGAEKSSAWVLEQLYAIINARYEEERSVVITTNLERNALAEQITERTVSRLEEMCEVLPLFGHDHRTQVQPVSDDTPDAAADIWDRRSA